MKKFITDIRTLAALLMASATIAACSGSDDSIVSEPQQQAATTKTCTLTVNASKGGDATTRALTLDESGAKNVLNATWTAGDKVTVFYLSEQDMGGGNTMNIPTEIGTLTAQSSGASTTLTGEITTTDITIRFSSETHDLTAGDKLYLSYSGTKGEGGKVYDAEQDGTLQTLADYFDSAGAELTVSSISGSTVNTTEGTANFENNSFIIRFTLKDKATDNAINPSSLVLECTTTGEYPLVGTQVITIPDAAYTTNGNGVVFVQLERTNQTTGFSGNITLTATVGDDTYTYTTSSDKTFTNGQYYEITVKMTKQAAPTLANTMTTAGMTVKVKYNYDGENYCQFLSNGDGTYTFQSGGGYVGGTAGMAKALVVENGKLVFKQNEETTIDDNWEWCGYSVTFDTSNNTYTQWAAELIQETYSPSFTSVEVNGTTIALQPKITVNDLDKEEYEGWGYIVSKNSDMIYIDYDDYIRRCSDDAKLLQRDPDDEEWSEVGQYDGYKPYYIYKFEGD